MSGNWSKIAFLVFICPIERNGKKQTPVDRCETGRVGERQISPPAAAVAAGTSTFTYLFIFNHRLNPLISLYSIDKVCDVHRRLICLRTFSFLGNKRHQLWIDVDAVVVCLAVCPVITSYRDGQSC